VDARQIQVARRQMQDRAVAGDHQAQWRLGMLLELDPPDLPAARRWYEAAADFGLVPAQFDLATMLETRWVPPDLDAARQWYEGAAVVGLPEAQLGLARLLLKLDPPDPDGARFWAEQAATNPIGADQHLLAELFDALGRPKAKPAKSQHRDDGNEESAAD